MYSVTIIRVLPVTGDADTQAQEAAPNGHMLPYVGPDLGQDARNQGHAPLSLLPPCRTQGPLC